MQKLSPNFKNKGNRSDCNSYCSISLLCIIAKLFAQVALKRPQGLGESLLRINCNVLSELTGQPFVWCSDSNSCRKNAGNNGNHSVVSQTSRKFLTVTFFTVCQSRVALIICLISIPVFHCLLLYSFLLCILIFSPGHFHSDSYFVLAVVLSLLQLIHTINHCLLKGFDYSSKYRTVNLQ